MPLGLEGGLTPSDSIMSLGSLQLWAHRGAYLPDKLQIVKPLEGERGGGLGGPAVKGHAAWRPAAATTPP